ncbi:hypothetical protein ACHAWC_011835 [Mediolabrus comicus]
MIIATRIRHLLLLLLLFLTGTVLSCFAFGAASFASLKLPSWKPCIQPRFDEFASITVGPWVTRDALTEKLEVEEVMRACGGAVQGIRELPLSVASQSQNDNEEKIYLNRADEGFVYIDDGSYSFGPEKWDVQSDEAVVMTSLAFTGNKRVWMTASMSRVSGIMPQSTVLELFRPATTQDTEKLESHVDSGEYGKAIPTIKWQKIQRARMPNPTQPWSLARAKWEQQILIDEAKQDDHHSKIGSLSGWSFVEEESGKSSELFADVLGADDTSFNSSCWPFVTSQQSQNQQFGVMILKDCLNA